MTRRRLAALLARVASGRSALHVIAHPDDEHAGALVWLAQVAGARTAIASLTRGESGANVVGPEVGRHLGLRRTAEMVAAARVYGVDAVHVASAPDYGYSRRLAEAWSRWDRDRLRAELAAIIRRERPTVILSRFFGGPGDGHAHHQAAALLAREAAIFAADPVAGPELGPAWKALRVFAGEVPEGERVDAVVDASATLDDGATCVEVANAGYLHHETQDPRALLSAAVDHRVARYQHLAGPLDAGEPIFGGLPQAPSALLAAGRASELPAGVAASLDAAAAIAIEARAALATGDDDALRDAVSRARAALDLELDDADDLLANARADLDEAAALVRDGGVDRSVGPRAATASPRSVPSHDLPEPPPLPAIGIEAPDWIVVDGPAAAVSVVVDDRSRRGLCFTLEARAGSVAGAAIDVELEPGGRRGVALPLPASVGACRRIDFCARVAGGALSMGRVVDIASPLGPLRTVEPADARALRARAELAPDLRVAVVAGPSSIALRALEALGGAPRLVDVGGWPSSVPRDVDTILVGERAFAVHPALRADPRPLRDLCERGVHVVVLSQTPAFDPAVHAPLPATLPVDAEEVCEEDSPVTLLCPEHPQLCSPNRIDAADFDGWFDARGAKFFSAWDPAYLPLVELCDPGREPQRGVWLTAKVGAGRFTYCALAIERQLFAGVPGGFRLLANLVS